jgi:hypothetical protein
MRHVPSFSLLFVAIVLTASAFEAPPAHAQGKTYPSYYNRTPSPAYYDLGNEYDRDTYMNPNPFPSYTRGPYVVPPSNYGYFGPYSSFGYSYGGPFIYGHYDRMGRMAFRYGWW